MSQDLYEVLGAKPGASLDELKQRYHKLVRQVHPDKSRGEPKETAEEAFRNVQHAWEVLSNEEERRKYDQARGSLESHKLAATEVDIDDLPYDGEENCFWHKCRCGDRVKVSEDALDKGIDVFECATCSLRVRVLYEVLQD